MAGEPDAGGRFRWLRRWAAALAMAVVVADRLFPPPLDKLRDLSAVVTDRNGRPLHIFLNDEDAWRLPVTVERAPEVYVALLMAREDQRFRWHPGVDPLALARAVAQNLSAGRIVSGASTLTMQTARLLEPRPRTLTTKLIEVARALQLEARFSKDEVLEMYLTLAPFGGNVEGIVAASTVLFGKPPEALSVAEAALLVALPQAPSRLRPDRWPTAARAARNVVLANGVDTGALTAAAADEALQEPTPLVRHTLPRNAWHLAGRLHRQAPTETTIATTIDGPLQHALEALARREQAHLLDRAGLSILIVDNASGELRAGIGAADPLDDSRHGAIDMTRAVRSPGSAMKPFVYGLAFDDGLLRPETLIADVSTRFGAYAPGNFTGDFRGDVTAAEALQRSLNVPAVLVLSKLKPERFAAALTRAGVTLHFPKNAPRPGLPMALGGLGITLRDLTRLYAGLANGGRVRPLFVRAGAAVQEGELLMSLAAARQVLSILIDAPPPPGIAPATIRTDSRAIAMKTGTSYGYRDAWAVGVSRSHTVGVWVGRPDGSPSPDRLGLTTAAPIVHRVFDLLPRVEAPAGHRAIEEPPPELLRRLRYRAAGAPEAVVLSDPLALDLVFPPDGAVLPSVGGEERVATLTLVARGGRRPLTWLVDGRPLAITAVNREVDWRPERRGPARITVIDAEGRSDAAGVVVP